MSSVAKFPRSDGLGISRYVSPPSLSRCCALSVFDVKGTMLLPELGWDRVEGPLSPACVSGEPTADCRLLSSSPWSGDRNVLSCWTF